MGRLTFFEVLSTAAAESSSTSVLRNPLPIRAGAFLGSTTLWVKIEFQMNVFCLAADSISGCEGCPVRTVQAECASESHLGIVQPSPYKEWRY